MAEQKLDETVLFQSTGNEQPRDALIDCSVGIHCYGWGCPIPVNDTYSSVWKD